MSKPTGWWRTHPTILNVTVAGAWDSNGDGIGDFEGIRQHLDYLIDMGISGIRFQQVTRFDDDFEWFGLVAQDWFDVDPRYGTLDDFDRLAADCREKDFALMVMAVPEYLGWHHPDYLAAKQAHDEGRDDPRVDWFAWEDDGSVGLTWNHPGPVFANDGYLDAYLKHLEFWMDRGIGGYDADDLLSWRSISVDAVRRITGLVAERGGFITSEHSALEENVVRMGGFNAGTGRDRNRFYCEMEAMLEHDAEYIRRALARRRELVAHNLFPFQQFGDEMYERYTGQNWRYKLQMFRLQVAFNACLPDQVWAFANSIAYPTKPLTPLPELDCVCWGQLDLPEISRQEPDPESPYNYFRRIFALRSREKALGIGEIEEVPTDNRKTVFAALRTSEDGTEQALVLFNFAEEPLEICLSPVKGVMRLRNYLSEEELLVRDGEIRVRVDRYGFKLWKVIE